MGTPAVVAFAYFYAGLCLALAKRSEIQKSWDGPEAFFIMAAFVIFWPLYPFAHVAVDS